MILMNELYEKSHDQAIMVSPDAEFWPEPDEKDYGIAEKYNGQFDDLKEPNNEELKRIEQFEQQIKYKFKNKSMGRLALAMQGYNKIDKLDNNERLEFLGDAVLDYLGTGINTQFLIKISLIKLLM